MLWIVYDLCECCELCAIRVDAVDRMRFVWIL